MTRILICTSRDNFIPFNEKNSYNETLFNSGNHVFEFSLQKTTLSKKHQIDIKTIEWVRSNPKEINKKYDMCLHSPANILGSWAKQELKAWEKSLKEIKIPFHFIGVGAQSKKYTPCKLASKIKKEGYAFIKSILNTGGKIGLRGHFTAEVVENLGFSKNDFHVLGCPSLFMNGPNLRINKSNIQKPKPIFNGNKFWFNSDFHHYFNDHPESIFVCQDKLYPLLYDLSYFNSDITSYLQGSLFHNLCKEKRVRLYTDLIPWINEIKNEHFNFCIGTRIHGNIVSLLAGIPSCLDVIDSRTKELADFFEIPSITLNNPRTHIMDIYDKLDFDKFNKNFKNKFQNFKNFMNLCGIPCFENNTFTHTFLDNLSYPPFIPKTNINDICSLSQRYKNHISKRSNLYKFLHFYWLRKKK